MSRHRNCARHPSRLPLVGAIVLLLVANEVVFAKKYPDPLPAGWRVSNSIDVPRNLVEQFSRKFGGRISTVENHLISADGKTLKVNILTCPTEQDAQTVYDSLVKFKQSAFGLRLAGREVREMVCPDLNLARLAATRLGFQAQRVTYRVNFDAAPLAKSENMQWNNLFRAFLRFEQEPQAASTIERLKQQFEFTDSLTLRAWGSHSRATSFQFDPRPTSQADLAAGEIRQFTFDDLPLRAGVPYVRVTALVSSEAFSVVPASRKDLGDLRRQTPSWPSDDAAIQSLAKEIIRDAKTDRDKAEAIMAWVNQSLRYQGPVTGSRYGVKQVLNQKFGHCWDYADVFVTLCRASDLPTRQVLGWLYGKGVSGGHVWAEVLIKDQGWIQLDPTANFGCDSRYVAYLVSEDGRVPLVYASNVKIEVVE